MRNLFFSSAQWRHGRGQTGRNGSNGLGNDGDGWGPLNSGLSENFFVGKFLPKNTTKITLKIFTLVYF